MLFLHLHYEGTTIVPVSCAYKPRMNPDAVLYYQDHGIFHFS